MEGIISSEKLEEPIDSTKPACIALVATSSCTVLFDPEKVMLCSSITGNTLLIHLGIWFSKKSGNDIIKDYSKAEGDKIVFFKESSDNENFSISDSNKINWGSLSIELEGVTLSSENDVFVEFIEIA